MKYTPHIIAAVAVAVVATAALATTSSNNTITFEIQVNNALIKNIGTEYWFSSSDTIKITASEPIKYRYYVIGVDGLLHDETTESATLQLKTSLLGKHTIDWTNIDQSSGWQGGTLTKIHIIPPADRG